MNDDQSPHSGSADGSVAGSVKPVHSVTTPPTLISDRNSVFMGPEGLRPGWGLLLFFFIFAGFRAIAFIGLQDLQPRSAVSAAHSQPARGEPAAVTETAGEILLYEGVGFSVVALTTWIMSRIEHRPIAQYGFWPKARLAPAYFFSGFAWGIAVLLSLLVGCTMETRPTRLRRPPRLSGAPAS